MKESGLRIRVEKKLRLEFIALCRKHDLTASQVLRAFMRDYIKRGEIEDPSNLFQDNESSISGRA